MEISVLTVFLSLSTAAVLSYISTPFVIKLAYKMGIVDDPQKNRHEKVIHTYPVPRGGSLAIFLGLIGGILLFLPIDKYIVGVIFGATLLVILGLLDDKYNLNPYLRLGILFVAALIPIASGIGIAFITNPVGGIIDLSQPQISINLLGETRSIWVLSDLFALFWIVFMMNILNLGAKGIDGQLPGVVVIAAATVALISIRFSADIAEWPIIILAVITLGAFLGFLPWNFYPQKIMPGFGGSTLAGYFLAILSILSTAKVGTLLIVLGVPIVDTAYTILRRLLQGRSPFWGDRGHLHHKLLDVGLNKRQVVYFYWFTSALLGALALNLNASYKLYTIVGVVIMTGGLLLWLSQKSQKTN